MRQGRKVTDPVFLMFVRGSRKWTYYHLYVILDIFSCYVPGWMVPKTENAYLAKQLIAETFKKQSIIEDQLIIHADRGANMKAKLVAELMTDLGVTKSHSGPLPVMTEGVIYFSGCIQFTSLW